MCSHCLIIWDCFPTSTTSPLANKAVAAAWLVYHLSFPEHWFFFLLSFYLLHKKKDWSWCWCWQLKSFWGCLSFLAWAYHCLLSDEGSWIIKPFVNVYGDICSGKLTFFSPLATVSMILSTLLILNYSCQFACMCVCVCLLCCKPCIMQVLFLDDVL